MKIAVIGAQGFVGSAIANAIINDSQHELISIIRGDNIESKLEFADVVIHSANPAKRFVAESNPWHDFNETVEKTSYILSLIQNQKVLLISSLSCLPDSNASYGNYSRNRRSCELLALAQNAIVMRLGPMFGGLRKQDVLHDLISNKQIYVSAETRYAYADVEWLGIELLKFLDKPSGIYEIGARNSISLAELQDIFKSTSTFSGLDDTQVLVSESNGPDARLVVEYAQKELENIDKWK
jgi:nucleoside-diphosphate-sugar epimerase